MESQGILKFCSTIQRVNPRYDAAPPGLQTVRGPDVYRDKDGNYYNKDFKQINEKFEVVHARGSRGGKRTRPEHKVSYSVDHRPWVFDPVTGRRERPTDARSSTDRWAGSDNAAAGEQPPAPGAAAGAGEAAAGAAEGSGGQWWQNNGWWEEADAVSTAGTGEDNGDPWAGWKPGNDAVWDKASAYSEESN